MTEIRPYPPAPTDSTRSTQPWTTLPDVFFRPTRFFRSANLAQGLGWLAAIWVEGMASTIGRIDQNLMRSDLGRPRLGWESFGPVLTQSWVAFWTFVVLTGALGAAFIWYLGGWCYNLRLHWSGATDFDEREGRLVYVFAGLVAALPSLGYALLTTILFPNYQAAWDSKELWSVLPLAFPFCAYTIALGVVGILYTLVTSDAPRATA